MQTSPRPESRTRALAPVIVLSALVAAGTSWAVASRVQTADPRTSTDRCAASPGFTATRSANDRARDCIDARKVEQLLVESGARKANVSIATRDSASLLGPDRIRTVTAQVFLTADAKSNWDAHGAGTAIAHAAGTTPSEVIITDGSLQTIFDGAARTTSRKRMDESANPLFHGDEVSAQGAPAVTPPS
jgi:hypothetical protein